PPAPSSRPARGSADRRAGAAGWAALRTPPRWGRGGRAGPARGDDLVPLQEDEVVEVVVDQQAGQDDAVEREEVLAGVDLADEEHVEGPARLERVEADDRVQGQEGNGRGRDGGAG